MSELAKAPTVDESLSAIEARCRRDGVEPTEAALRDMRAQWFGCTAGRAMSAYVTSEIDRRRLSETERKRLGEADRQRLWGAIQHIRTAWARYVSLHGMPGITAQCLRIVLPPDGMHADASTPARDLRPMDERAADALRIWRQAELLVGRYGRGTAGITMRCVLADTRCEDATSMVLALRSVADYLDGTK